MLYAFDSKELLQQLAPLPRLPVFFFSDEECLSVLFSPFRWIICFFFFLLIFVTEEPL